MGCHSFSESGSPKFWLGQNSQISSKQKQLHIATGGTVPQTVPQWWFDSVSSILNTEFSFHRKIVDKL